MTWLTDDHGRILFAVVASVRHNPIFLYSFMTRESLNMSNMMGATIRAGTVYSFGVAFLVLSFLDNSLSFFILFDLL